MMEEKSVDTTNVFVKFLPASVDDMALLKMFSPFGRIVSYKVMIDPGTLKSLGYGYVFLSKRKYENVLQICVSSTQNNNTKNVLHIKRKYA
jgi:RNA recognition motif-containing protein